MLTSGSITDTRDGLESVATLSDHIAMDDRRLLWAVTVRGHRNEKNRIGRAHTESMQASHSSPVASVVFVSLITARKSPLQFLSPP